MKFMNNFVCILILFFSFEGKMEVIEEGGGRGRG